jgi:hypothetical protein
VRNKKLGWVISQLLAGTNTDFKPFGTQVSLFDHSSKKQPKSPEFTISAYLLDHKTHDPLIGATVIEPITYKGTTTNISTYP